MFLPFVRRARAWFQLPIRLSEFTTRGRPDLLIRFDDGFLRSLSADRAFARPREPRESGCHSSFSGADYLSIRPAFREAR
jgi:hypothetical protein